MSSTPSSSIAGHSVRFWLATALVAMLAAGGAAALLVNVLERKNEARNPFFRVVELTDETEDPAVWGQNFPLQYDGYKRTVDMVRTRYGGSEAVPRSPTERDPRTVVSQSRIQEDPRLVTMWAGLCLLEGLPGGTGPRLHARRPAVHRAPSGHAAARNVPPLPRLHVPALQESRQRRSHQGL